MADEREERRRQATAERNEARNEVRAEAPR
jgi:hypothetical protein